MMTLKKNYSNWCLAQRTAWAFTASQSLCSTAWALPRSWVLSFCHIFCVPGAPAGPHVPGTSVVQYFSCSHPLASGSYYAELSLQFCCSCTQSYLQFVLSRSMPEVCDTKGSSIKIIATTNLP